VDPDTLKKYNCNNGSVCEHLTGLFNCSLGHCANWTERYQCQFKADGNVLVSDKDNMKMNGFYECNNSRCVEIKQQLICDRYCNKIATSNNNVFVLHDDSVYSGECTNALAYTSANGSAPGIQIEPKEFWNKNNDTVLFTSCMTVTKTAEDLT
jgi:ABC-type Fe3+-citrate transport system substrate-binding protein